MDVHFRKMTYSDLPRIAELERVCFAIPWSEASLRGELNNGLSHYQVATLDGEIVAYADMWVFLGEAHITNVAVAPEYRRQGLGKAIMLHMMKKAVKHKANAMTLEVRQSNLAAQALYYSLGFEKAGARKRYYHDTKEDALILWNTDIAATIDSLPAE